MCVEVSLAKKGKAVIRLNNHNHFIQGVAFDPRMKYIVTQSSDRTVKVWKDSKNKNKVNFYVFAVKYLNSEYKKARVSRRDA